MEKEVIRILFIGNSLIYYNEMPQVLSAFSKAEDMEQVLLTEQETVGGWSFENFGLMYLRR